MHAPGKVRFSLAHYLISKIVFFVGFLMATADRLLPSSLIEGLAVVHQDCIFTSIAKLGAFPLFVTVPLTRQNL